MNTKTNAAEGSSRKRAARPPMSPLKKGIFAAIALVLVLSIVARAVLSGGEDAPQGTSGGAGAEAHSLTQGGAPGPGGSEAAEEKGSLEKALPYVTEASFFGMIGFALGYASKKFMKLGLILVAVLFVGLQLLSRNGVISIDWGRAVELLNGFVLNVKEGETVTQVITDRIPSAGALLGAFFVGFKSG